MSYLFTDRVDFKGEAIDAFSRLKISDSFTIFDSQHRYRENEKFDTKLIGNSGITFSLNESVIMMEVGKTAGDHVIRQTKYVFPYQPGKSLLILNTFVFNTPKNNLLQTVGYYNDYNGIFLEQNGLTASMVLRSYVTGATVERRIPQHEWNGDVFDGSGASGRTLAVDKANIFWTDIEWLGVGDVRTGFFVDGRPVIAHTFHNDNINPTTYMTTATLPIRYELKNLANTGTTAMMRQICSSVISEGGYDSRAITNYAGSNAINEITLGAAGVPVPIVAIRLRSDRLDAPIVPADIQVVVTSNSNVCWKVVLNPTLSGGTWVTFSNYSSVQYNKTITSVTGGIIIKEGYVAANATERLSTPGEFIAQIGRTIDGVSDILLLEIAPLTGNQTKVYANLGWQELDGRR
jgi:hypothetical protein